MDNCLDIEHVVAKDGEETGTKTVSGASGDVGVKVEGATNDVIVSEEGDGVVDDTMLERNDDVRDNIDDDDTTFDVKGNDAADDVFVADCNDIGGGEVAVEDNTIDGMVSDDVSIVIGDVEGAADTSGEVFLDEVYVEGRFAVVVMCVNDDAAFVNGDGDKAADGCTAPDDVTCWGDG